MSPPDPLPVPNSFPLREEYYKLAAGVESVGASGVSGIQIRLYHSAFVYNDRDPLHQALANVLYRAKADIADEMMAIAYATDPKAQAESKANRSQILLAFPDRSVISVQEIPNGYSSRGYVRHLPWFKVLTRIGYVTVGWRKRVIELSWEGTDIEQTAEDLFPDEEVTKGDRSIHAWSLERLSHYLDTVLKIEPPSTEVPASRILR